MAIDSCTCHKCLKSDLKTVEISSYGFGSRVIVLCKECEKFYANWVASGLSKQQFLSIMKEK